MAHNVNSFLWFWVHYTWSKAGSSPSLRWCVVVLGEGLVCVGGKYTLVGKVKDVE